MSLPKGHAPGHSTSSATRSRTCSVGSRTGAASPPATTDAPTPSSQPSAADRYLALRPNGPVATQEPTNRTKTPATSVLSFRCQRQRPYFFTLSGRYR
jgi:hypothetical protein